MKGPLPQAGGKQSTPGLLSSLRIFTPFLVNPTPHVSPTSLLVSLPPEHLSEVFEVGKRVPATSFSGWKEGGMERDSGHLERLLLDVFSKEPQATELLRKSTLIIGMDQGQRTSSQQQGVQRDLYKSQTKREIFKCPS